jgi:hypothetical protein
MQRIGLIIGALIAVQPVPALAQSGGLGEIIVTASRREVAGAVSEDDEEAASRVPAIGLRRTADYAVWFVNITGDTRETARRQQEIYDMLRNAVQLAGKNGGIELGTGTYVVEPLTMANYRNVPLSNAGRSDSERANFIIKTKLVGGLDAKAALAKVEAFIKAVQPVGRAELTRNNDQTLSIVNPDQYRSAIADLIAADAKAYAARFGPEYRVEVGGIDRPVEWSRASLTEVVLYLPYSYRIIPARP